MLASSTSSSPHFHLANDQSLPLDASSTPFDIDLFASLPVDALHKITKDCRLIFLNDP